MSATIHHSAQALCLRNQTGSATLKTTQHPAPSTQREKQEPRWAVTQSILTREHPTRTRSRRYFSYFWYVIQTLGAFVLLSSPPSFQTSTIHLGIYHTYHHVEPVKCRWQVCELQVQLSCHHSKPTKGAWSPSLPLAGRRWTPVRSRYMGTEQARRGRYKALVLPAYSTPCARLGPCHYHKTSKHQGKCPPARPAHTTYNLPHPTYHSTCLGK